MSEILNKYESDRNYNLLSDKQKKALEIFGELLDSLFSAYPVESSVSISDVVELKFADKGLSYQFIVYDSGKCSLGVVNESNGNSTLNSYPSVLQASFEAIKIANEQSVKEITTVMRKRFKRS